MKAREIFTEGSTDGRPVNVNVTVTLDSARLSQNIDNIIVRSDSKLEWHLYNAEKRAPGTIAKYKQFQDQVDEQMTKQLHQLTLAYHDTAHLALAEAQQQLIAFAQQLVDQNGQDSTV